MVRAIRYFVKYPRKYRATWCPCGCEHVGRSKRALKAAKKGHYTVFKVRP